MSQESTHAVETTAASASDQRQDPVQQEQQQYIAVVRGKEGLRSCIFLEWDDAKAFVASGDESGTEYSVFDTLKDAVAYLQDAKAKPKSTTVLPEKQQAEAGQKRKRDKVADDATIHSPPAEEEPSKTKVKKKRPKQLRHDAGYETTSTRLDHHRRFMKPNAKWNAMYQALQDYKADHGGQWPKAVPKAKATTKKETAAAADDAALESSTTPNSNKENTQDDDPTPSSEQDLVQWMETQRYHYRLMREGKKACMNPIKVRLLEAIEFEFAYVSWDTYLEALREVQQGFLQQQQGEETLEEHLDKILVHPFCNHRYEGDREDGSGDQDGSATKAKSTANPKVGYHDLGKWFYKQREQCRLFLQGKPCTITKAHMEQLFALGVCNPAQLVAPRSKKIKKSVLLKQEKAQQDRTTKLEQESQHFETMFRALLDYKRLNGSTHVPKSLQTPLSKWVVSIKNMYRRLRQDDPNHQPSKQQPRSGGGPSTTILTAARIQRLHDIGFVFAMTEKQPYLKFHEWVERLKAFQQDKGHCRGMSYCSTNEL